VGITTGEAFRRGLLFLFVLCVSASCQKGADEGPTTLERIRSEGVIKVGYANEAPYAYYDSEAARLTGEAPEIAREIANRMGIERVEGVLTEFGSLLHARHTYRAERQKIQ